MNINLKNIGYIAGGLVGLAALKWLFSPSSPPSPSYDENGYDKDGYDKNGYDRSGYDRQGFNHSGYNAQGFNRRGWDRDGYNASGMDRAGHNRKYYSDYIGQLRGRLDEAYQQLQRGEFRYAIYDARVVMEEALRLIVQHVQGCNEVENKMVTNLKICENKHLLKDTEFIERLHSVRRICNANGHELDAENSMTHNKVHFVVMQIRELLDCSKKILATT